MSKLLEKMASEGLLNQEQVDRIRKTVSSVVKEARDNPAFVKEASGKYIGFREAMKASRGPLAAGAAFAGMGMAGNLAIKGVGKLHDTVMKSRWYDSMIEANPTLSEYPAEKVHRAFNTLHKFSPQYASDPLVAGTFVHNAVDQARMDVQQINSILKARNDMASAQRQESPLEAKTLAQSAPISPTIT